MEFVEIICGIDEAGRGPLAGPVVAAAVILDKKRRINGLNDSKQLTEERRDILALRIKERAIAWGVGVATVEAEVLVVEVTKPLVVRNLSLVPPLSTPVQALCGAAPTVVMSEVHLPR